VAASADRTTDAPWRCAFQHGPEGREKDRTLTPGRSERTVTALSRCRHVFS